MSVDVVFNHTETVFEVLGIPVQDNNDKNQRLAKLIGRTRHSETGSRVIDEKTSTEDAIQKGEFSLHLNNTQILFLAAFNGIFFARKFFLAYKDVNCVDYYHYYYR